MRRLLWFHSCIGRVTTLVFVVLAVIGLVRILGVLVGVIPTSEIGVSLIFLFVGVVCILFRAPGRTSNNAGAGFDGDSDTGGHDSSSGGE
jgi:hypothetical protein